MTESGANPSAMVVIFNECWASATMLATGLISAARVVHRTVCGAIVTRAESGGLFSGARADTDLGCLWTAARHGFTAHPNRRQAADGHPFVGVAFLRERDGARDCARDSFTCGLPGPRDAVELTPMAVDAERCRYGVAGRPSKAFRVDVASVKKKMKDKAFARAVNREDIVRGAAELGMPLEDVIAGVIAALKADAERLQLAGTAI